MIFAFLDDMSVSVLFDEKEAIRQYESIDIENGDVVLYNDDGVHLEQRFIVPSRRRKFWGIIPYVTSGIYELVTAPQSKTYEYPIWIKLNETGTLNPNRWFKDLDELKTYLRGKGVVVDDPRPKA